MTKQTRGPRRLNSVSPDANEMVDKTRSCWSEEGHGMEIDEISEANPKLIHTESEGEGSNSRLVKDQDIKSRSEVKLKSVEVGVSEVDKGNILSVENEMKPGKDMCSSQHHCEQQRCIHTQRTHSLTDIINKIFQSKRFESDKLERLYQRYFFRLNQKFLNWITCLIFLLLAVLVGLHFGVEAGEKEHYWLKGLFFPLIFILYIGILIVINRSNSTQKHLRMSAYTMLLLSCCFVLVDFLFRPKGSAADGVWLCIFFIYLTYTLLPVRMRLAVFGGCGVATVHLVCSARGDLAHDDQLYRLVSSIYPPMAIVRAVVLLN